ncbi:MAG: ABC transporter ATP-binding protein [Armatimonadetes bacterium]|nr:ABC transporter ATP-binding protein [Armatimonadota bacterium]
MLSVNIQKQLRDFALDVDFVQDRQQTLVLIGPSGCGKSTTLNAIAGTVPLDSGRIVLDDRVLYDRAARIDIAPNKREIGFVYQDFALFPHKTVFENIAYGLRCRKKSKAEIHNRVARLMETMQISHLAQARPQQLSGGQQQRVALARALAIDTHILLLDEPLGALDAQTRMSVRSELKRILKSFDVVSIIVTHDFVDALVLGDAIGVMEEGRILQLGSREELLLHPKSKFVADFTGVNFFQGQVVSRNGDGWCHVRVGETHIHTPCTDAGRISLAFFPRDVTLHRDPPKGSAQNSLRGAVREILHLGDRIRVTIDSALPIVAEISDMALEDMELKEGDTIYAAFKATAIKTYS